jgi:hypothetical protein
MEAAIRISRALRVMGSVVVTARHYAAAAAPQVLGLACQVLIIKVFFAAAAAQTLSAYQFALTVSSILYMGLAYQKTLRVIGIGPVLVAQSLLLMTGIVAYRYGSDYMATLALFLSYFLSISLVQYAVLRFLDGNLYLIVSALISVVSPQLLWIGEPYVLILAGLALLTFVVVSGRKIAEQEGLDADVPSAWAVVYNILLHAPLLSLALFDPFLAGVVGSSFYVNFVLFQKITNGIGILAFSRLQMRIVLKQYRIRRIDHFAVIFVMIALASASAGVFAGQYALLVQCILLSLNINVASIVVRDHLQWGQPSLGLVVISVGAVLAYGVSIYTCFRLGWHVDDVITLMIIVITLPAAVILAKSHARGRVGAAVRN